MRKELITVFATILTSTMIVIPVQAATPAEGDVSGGFIGLPREATGINEAIGLEENDPGDVTEDKEIMDAFGGVDKYYASHEHVTPEYFKQKYAEAAESLKEKIDTTSTDTIISSAITAVNNHFTTRWSELGYNDRYAFRERMFTDYLMTGRLFSGFEPAVLLHTILDSYDIENDLWDGYSDDYTCYVSIPMDSFTRYVAFGGPEMLMYDMTPTDLYSERFVEMYPETYEYLFD